MLTSDFDYPLPSDQIASHPAPRGRSRLMVVPANSDNRLLGFSDLPSLLRPGDLLVLNNTRVLAARLFAVKEETGARIEVLLVQAEEDEQTWRSLIKPAKRLGPGDRLTFEGGLTAIASERLEGGSMILRFSEPPAPLLDRIGHVPLPPYLGRQDTEEDRERYQTVYASRPGAIAAPTAGLHFSVALLDTLRRGGVEIAELTLHVGPGTFRPVTADDLTEHKMEVERYSVSRETADCVERARRDQRRVIAVGTTVVRALESAARDDSGGLRRGAQTTGLFIVPGHRFRTVDCLLTNFHLPKSTLLMLVSAFAGHARVMAAYRQAIGSGFRFYSYGDAMFLERSDGD